MTIAVTLAPGADLAGFRRAVRRLVAADIAPDAVSWGQGGATDLFGEPLPETEADIRLPRTVADLVEKIGCHRDPERWALLFRLVWRLLHGERDLLARAHDPLVHRLMLMHKSVHRDLHKMHAFLRFRCITTPDGERYIAWFEPEHFILEATADFFVDRFRSLDFTIVTPVGTLRWTGGEKRFGPPGRRADLPEGDEFEAGWSDYFAAVFNPARLNLTAMRAEMPKKYWRNMPETRLIPALVRAAGGRTEAMLAEEARMSDKRDPQRAVARMADQEPKTLEALNAIIVASEPLVPGATSAVLGEGPMHPMLALVGEQPGDQEDVEGRPFVGPAGQLLDRALAEAGIDRGATYLTNAVKHFKFVQRGKRRLHQKPTAGEIRHYRWWLMRELDLVAPRLVVALGATATQALAGRALPVTLHRGPAEFEGRRGFITVHPSFLLRLPDPEARREAYQAFVRDLAAARSAAEAA